MSDGRWRLKTHLRHAAFAYSLRTGGIVIAAVCLLLFLMCYRPSAKALTRQEAAERICRIFRAVQDYAQVFGDLPSPTRVDSLGRQLPSWRLLMLATAIGRNAPGFNEPWNVQLNRNWAGDYAGRNFCFLSDTGRFSKRYTKIMALIGPETAYDVVRSGKAFSEVDGDTILLVEVTDSGVHWIQPGDIDIRTVPKEINPPRSLGISGNFEGGIFVGFVDGEVWFLSDQVPFDELEKFFTVELAQQFDREEVLGSYVIAKESCDQGE